MEFIKKIKSGIYNGIGFILVIGFAGISYAAYEALTDVTSGDTLTYTIFNKVLENQRVFRSEIDVLSGASSGSVPANAIMAFNQSACPSGWSKADGTSGNPDLRGEFIRGLDEGRGVDTGRVLASTQTDEFKAHNHQVTKGGSGNAANGFFRSITNHSADYTGTTGGGETRPRNVALLYCVKD